ncbi:sigma factor [Neorhizobium sp. BT27B]|uniref:RNA polymerase sigma factor n=1 Tax=Neorhizobium sp. BT27B TaxID=3142625 RepID=UPI001042CC00
MTIAYENIAKLYAAEHDRLERQIFWRIGCRATAGDLVHDIFLRLWEKATQPRGSDAAYLTRCA